MGGIEIIHFKPQEGTVTGWNVWVTNRAMMMVRVPPVQLQYEAPLRDQSLIMRTTMGAPAVKETLIPSAAGFNIAHANQWLWTHRDLLV